MPSINNDWFSLDNAAKLYPAIHSQRLPMVFRVSAVLTSPVNVTRLQAALDRLILRFPYYKVRLRAGFFWYFLEENDATVTVRRENDFPCQVLPDYDGNGYLFRVQAYKRRVSVEFSHIITDGTGALIFLKSLLAEYFKQGGSKVEEWGGIISSSTEVDPEEYEDAYARYNSGTSPKPDRLTKAFRLPYPLTTIHRYTCTTGECSARRIAREAGAWNVSVTEYLAGLYLYVLQSIFHDLPDGTKKRMKKMLRVQIPVNLRRLYPTKSMRNFTLFVTPGIDLRLGWYELDDILQRVHRYMQNDTDKRHIDQQLARNQNPERNVFLRLLPLLAKNLLLYTRYTNWGPTQYSGVLTNLGKIEMPPSIAGEIEYFTFIPPPGRELRVHGAVATYGDRVRITFGNVTATMELQRRFFSFLVDTGIPVRIYRYKDL